DDHDAVGRQRARACHDMGKHGQAAYRVQDFGQLGTHARAHAGGEDDDIQHMGKTPDAIRIGVWWIALSICSRACVPAILWPLWQRERWAAFPSGWRRIAWWPLRRPRPD